MWETSHCTEAGERTQCAELVISFTEFYYGGQAVVTWCEWELSSLWAHFRYALHCCIVVQAGKQDSSSSRTAIFQCHTHFEKQHMSHNGITAIQHSADKAREWEYLVQKYRIFWGMLLSQACTDKNIISSFILICRYRRSHSTILRNTHLSTKVVWTEIGCVFFRHGMSLIL